MKRLTLVGSWKRIGLQLGSLAALGLAFFGAPQAPATAADDCPDEDECSFKKPSLMILMNYSTSMNEAWDGDTRWETIVAAVEELVSADNGYLSHNLNLSLMRFGHDPNEARSGTTIPGTSLWSRSASW